MSGLPATGNLAAPLDAAIDQTDTYVVTEVEVTGQTELHLEAAVYDPLTNQMTTSLTLDHGRTNLRVETGYTAGGDIVVAEYDLDAPGDPTRHLLDDARGARGIGNDHVIFDGAYQPIPTTPISAGGGGGDELSPIYGISDQVGVLGDGIVLSEEEAAALTSPGPAGVMSGAAGGPVAERLPGGGLRVRMDLGPGLSAAVPGTGTLTRTYRPGRSRAGEAALVLAEVVFEVDEPAGRGQTRTRETVRFKAVDWQRNGRRDDERRARPRQPGGMGQAPGPGPSSAPALSSPALCEEMLGGLDASLDSCHPPGGGGGGGYTPPPPTTCSAEGTQNLVLQHGILSSAAGAWGEPWETTKTRAYLTSRYCLGALVAPNLPNKAIGSHQSQADVLKAAVTETGANGFVIVGHSQGGVVARRAAQQFVAAGRPDLVEGVVTIGTPHQGAYFAKSLYDGAVGVISRPLSSFTECGNPIASAVCSVVLDAALRAAIDGVLQLAGPAAIDNRPGSAALAELERNRGTLEQSFLRYGVQHYPHKRWMPVRMAGDWGGNLRGQVYVDRVTWLYRGVRVGGWVSLFSGWAPGYAISRSVTSKMDWLDRGYDRLTAPGMESDGVIHGPSQVYPGAHRQLTARGREAVSHVSETQSPATRRRLDELFPVDFGVEARR